MRAVREGGETTFFIASKPDMDSLSTHTKSFGHLCDLHSVPDNGQDSVITLFHFAELHEHSATSSRSRAQGSGGQGVKHQPNTCQASPEYLSGINRTRVWDQPERKRLRSTEVIHLARFPRSCRT